MTLQQWIDAGNVNGRPVPFQRSTDGRIAVLPIGTVRPHYGYVIPDDLRPDRPDAWRLADYRVVSVSGGSIWFTPRA